MVSSESDGSAVLEGGVCLVQSLMQRQQDSLGVWGWALSFSSIISAMGFTVVWPGPH